MEVVRVWPRVAPRVAQQRPLAPQALCNSCCGHGAEQHGPDIVATTAAGWRSRRALAAARSARNAGPILLAASAGTVAVAISRYSRRAKPSQNGAFGLLGGSTICRAGAGDAGRFSDAEQRLQELKALRTRALKLELQAMGLPTEGCVDREALLELLERSVVVADDSDASGSSSRSNESATKVAERLNEMRQLRARPLRDELRRLGVDTMGCSDKDSLLELLETQGEAALERESIAAASVVQLPIEMVASPNQDGVNYDSKHIVLALALGGMNYRFVMDTGASHTLILESMASALPAKDLGIPAHATGAMGMQQGMRLIRVDEAALGPMACGPVDLVATAQLPIPLGTAGILGLDFIRLFDWYLDIGARCCKVLKPELPGAAVGEPPFNLQGMREVPMSSYTGALEVPTVALELRAGQRATGCLAVVDLGAGCTLCNTAAASALQLGSADLRDTGTVVTGVGGSVLRVQEAELTLAIGNGKDGPVMAQVSAMVGDLPFFAQLGLDNCGPVVLLGLDVLGAGSRLALSVSAGRLWLPTPAA